MSPAELQPAPGGAGTHDPFDLQRFVDAQAGTWDQALAQLRAGRKRTHWMWWVFPQLRGLGHSETARRYGLASLDEARAFLHHPLLGARLRAGCEALLALQGSNATAVLGHPDDLKLCSCLTLFRAAAPRVALWDALLVRYYAGQADAATLALLAAGDNSGPGKVS